MKHARILPVMAFALLAVSCTVNNTVRTNLASKVEGMGCPENFVEIPAKSPYTENSFCVAKYEMKIAGNADGNQTYSSAFVPESRATGTPWVNVTRAQAMDECQSLGNGYDLITNAEWQTVARNVESVGWNWSGGVVGATGGLNRGLGMSAGVAAASDQEPCVNTGQVCDLDTWNDSRRVHQLTTGNLIWDLGSNVAEWVKDQNFLTSDAIVNGLSGDEQTLLGPAGDYSSLNSEPYGGLGEVHGGSGSNGALVRGGAWGAGVLVTYNAGVFTSMTTQGEADTTDDVGFRCVYHPTVTEKFSLFGDLDLPQGPVDSDINSIEVGVQFIPTVNGKITAIRFYRGASNPDGYVVNLWTASGVSLGTQNTSDGDIPGWQTVTLSSPVAVTAGTTYVASYFTSNGAYAATNGFFNSSYVNSTYLSVPINGGIYTYATVSAFPFNTFAGSNYYVDVTFVPDL